MGAILEITEYLKEPVWMIAFIAMCAGIFFFVKWVLKDDEEQQ